jgi:hypothetical protein
VNKGGLHVFLSQIQPSFGHSFPRIHLTGAGAKNFVTKAGGEASQYVKNNYKAYEIS